MGQTNQIFTVPYRCISICGTSHSFSTCLWSPTVNFQQINIFNGIGIGLCCLNRHRCRVSNYMSKCKRLPSTEWSRFEGTMSFSLAAGFASWFQTRGRSSLVSLTSNVTFGHRSVATYRGPICQCQQKYMHKHTHTFPFVVSRHNGESSLQWTTLKKKKKGRSVLKCTAQQLSVPWPKQYHSARAPSYRIIPLSSQDKITTVCLPFAYPSLLSHLWDSLPLRAAHMAGRGRSEELTYLTDARKTSVTFTYASANAIKQHDSTNGPFLYMLACIHQILNEK